MIYDAQAEVHGPWQEAIVPRMRRVIFIGLALLMVPLVVMALVVQQRPMPLPQVLVGLALGGLLSMTYQWHATRIMYAQARREVARRQQPDA